MDRNEQGTVFDQQLVRRHDVSGPRYTSYPTADRFHDEVGVADVARQLGSRAMGGIGKPLSLYFHIPFCDTVCFYCACNKIVTKDHARAVRYLEYLDREMAMASNLMFRRPPVSQMHWGGGTPTFLADSEIRQLAASIRRYFELAEDGEFSVEVDPRRVGDERVLALASSGFNRMSVGVQDFDPLVQRAVNRVQTVEETRRVMAAARRTGFRSISIDLIYGLPLQTRARVSATLDQVLELSPDRLALYSYAHLPERFMPQRRIHAQELPSPDEKLDILGMAIERLTREGYVYIGMDHFAKPDDDLAVAQRRGCLYRNFQGYSTHAECDLLAFGVSAISKVGPLYAQNAKDLDRYYAAIDAGALPVDRGYLMSFDDQVRHALIQSLMCHFQVSFDAFGEAWGISFEDYFAEELAALQDAEMAPLCRVADRWLTVTSRGRMLVRVLAMTFDRHLRERRTAARYSRVI